MKNEKKLFLFIMVILILIPMIKFNFKENYVSAIDNKQLPNFPVYKNVSGTYSSNIDSYVNARFGYRSQIIKSFSMMNDKLFNYLVHPRYEYGKDGYIFLKIEEDEDDRVFLQSFADLLLRVQNYCEERDIPFLYIFSPSKSTVYTQELPSGYIYSDDRYEYFIEQLDIRKINYVDNTPMLIEKSMNEQLYNIKYDAGHWNDLGAFYGTNAVLERLHEMYPIVNKNELSDFNITSKTETLLMNSEFPIHEEIPVFESKANVITYSNYGNAIELDSAFSFFSHIINLDLDMQYPKVLSIQGSYLNSRLQFLQNQFREYIVIHNYENLVNFDYYYNVFQPDIVIVESAEYATNEDYFALNHVVNAIFSPSLETYDSYENVKEESIEEIEYEAKDVIMNMKVDLDLENVDYAYLLLNDEIFDMQKYEYDNYIQATFDMKYAKDIESMLIITINEEDGTKHIYDVTQYPFIYS